MARVVANKAGGWWLGTFVWGAILIAFLFGANRVGKKFGSTKPQTMLANTLVVTALFCCWGMWGILYMAQMNPLINPILSE